MFRGKVSLSSNKDSCLESPRQTVPLKSLLTDDNTIFTTHYVYESERVHGKKRKKEERIRATKTRSSTPFISQLSCLMCTPNRVLQLGVAVRFFCAKKIWIRFGIGLHALSRDTSSPRRNRTYWAYSTFGLDTPRMPGTHLDPVRRKSADVESASKLRWNGTKRHQESARGQFPPACAITEAKGAARRSARKKKKKKRKKERKTTGATQFKNTDPFLSICHFRSQHHVRCSVAHDFRPG